ncbi:MAG: hypothetical protein JXX28_00975 [Deltaproteobacteria bacterium]|nr:hypothetical protein [Deltaproteobacteria bacterium]
MVVVFGALSAVGEAAVWALGRAGVPARSLVSRGDPYHLLEGSGCGFRFLERGEGWERGLRGAAWLLVDGGAGEALPGGPRRLGPVLHPLLRAAEAEGLRGVVLVAPLGARGRWGAAWASLVDRAGASPLPLTVLRIGPLGRVWLDPGAALPERLAPLCADDAAAVALSCLDTPALRGGRWALCGRERITGGQARALIDALPAGPVTSRVGAWLAVDRWMEPSWIEGAVGWSLRDAASALALESRRPASGPPRRLSPGRYEAGTTPVAALPTGPLRYR